MGATAKRSEPTKKRDAKWRAKLSDRHRAILAPGEPIIETMSGVLPGSAQLGGWVSGALGGVVGALIGQALDRPRALARAAEINDHVGVPCSQFPDSKNGYEIALTPLRVLVFDRKANQLISEGLIANMSVSSIAHGSTFSSVIFSHGREHIAVTSLRGASASVNGFVAAFAAASGEIRSATSVLAGALTSPGVVEF